MEDSVRPIITERKKQNEKKLAVFDYCHGRALVLAVLTQHLSRCLSHDGNGMPFSGLRGISTWTTLSKHTQILDGSWMAFGKMRMAPRRQ